MGVRHKELLVEGVQFHPESILTAEGRVMLKNFLQMKGGTWTENEKVLTQSQPQVNGSSTSNGSESILDKIYRHRRAAVEAQKQIPSQRFSDLEMAYKMDLASPLVSFPDRLGSSPYPLSLMAEIKRASPSKGQIAMDICAPEQARRYAASGASVISVLTEPEWFKGSIDDLRAVRQSLEGMPSRPAVLRKEFIFDEYQILEARLAGADTLLLIVKMLERELLEKLYKYSQSLGMEPLVEVNTVEEMEIALAIGSKVIGVNNRNLTNFEVDLDTTSRLMANVPKDTFVCALSGISGPDDVKAYQQNGVGGVLVGEALMRASNVTEFVSRLLGGTSPPPQELATPKVLVKICGMRTPEAAQAAVDAGADFIGIILVEGRKRCVTTSTALEISDIVHSCSRETYPLSQQITKDYFEHQASIFRNSPRPLLVGVFQNQPLSHILEQQALLDLDVIQLHGSEPLEWARLIPVPVIRRFGPGNAGLTRRGLHTLPLLDSAAGGTGQLVNEDAVKNTLSSDDGLRVILAGGLNPDNVKDVLSKLQTSRGSIVAVDVSSGVEGEDGEQDLEKITRFVEAAKSV